MATSDTSNDITYDITCNITFCDFDWYVLPLPSAAEVCEFLVALGDDPARGGTAPSPAATPGDRQPTEWQPRTGRIHRDTQAVSAGGKLGKPSGGDYLRRYDEGAGDKYVGVAEDTLLPGWEVKECAHERWVAAPGDVS